MACSARSEQTAPLVAPPAPRLHLDFLDGLRALAALFVVLNHAWVTIWTPYSEQFPIGGVPYLTSWLRYGPFAVVLFIVLSGFCLMLPVLKSGSFHVNTAAFLTRRARRILPPYYGALGCSLVLIFSVIGSKTGTIWDASLPVDGRGVVMHLLLVHNALPVVSHQINYPLWSIAVEWQIYFLFPIMLLAWRRVGALAATLLAVFAGYAGTALLRNTPVHGLTLHYIGLFALGMVAAAISCGPDKKWRFWRDRLPWMGIAAIFFVLLVFVCRQQGVRVFEHAGSIDALVGIAASALLIAVSQQKTAALRRFLESRPLVWIGAFSYSLYLLHAPLLQALWQYGLHPLHLARATAFLLLILIGGPMIIGFSYLFYVFCEKPFINKQSSAQYKGSSSAAMESARN